MLGLPKGIVRLETYDPEWIRAYEKEKSIIEDCIRNYIIDIQHVGSTSIEGLIAKPIIDIAVGVPSLVEGHKCIEPLEQIGYEYKGEAGVVGRLYFTKDDGIIRIHHIHIEEVGSTNWWNQILFRDYLRLHNDARDEYGELKKILAQKYANDRETYTERKADFILDIIVRAKEQFFIKAEGNDNIL